MEKDQNKTKGDEMAYKKSKAQAKKEMERFNKIAKMKQESYTDEEIAEALSISSRTIRDTFKKYAKFAPEQMVEMGLDPKDVKHAWLKTDVMSAFYINPLFSAPEQIFELTEEIMKRMQKLSPKVKRKKYSKVDDPHMVEIDIADAHFGKLAVKSETGEEYNLDIAERRFKESVETLIVRASKGYNIEKINFIIGNDILHIDTPKRTTTSGTPQDTDGMWHEAFIRAYESYVWAIELLTTYAPVHVIFNTSNHDFMSGYMLAQTTQARFHSNKNVTFDVEPRDRKFYVYGKNMIMYHHGDGSKEKDFSILMATEQPQMWADTDYRYISGHHLHHHIGKELIGATFKAKRSISSSDRWHYANGYVSMAGADAEVYSLAGGKVAELIHYVK